MKQYLFLMFTPLTVTTDLSAQGNSLTDIVSMNECVYDLFKKTDSSKLYIFKKSEFTNSNNRITRIDSVNYKIEKTYSEDGIMISYSILNKLTRINLQRFFNSSGKLKSVGFTTSNNIKIGNWINHPINYELPKPENIPSGENFDVSPFVTFCDFYKIAEENNLTNGEFEINTNYDLGLWQIANLNKKELMEYDAFNFKMSKSKMK